MLPRDTPSLSRGSRLRSTSLEQSGRRIGTRRFVRSVLDGVRQEAETMQKVAGDAFSIQPLIQPCAKDTTTHIGESEIVHFVCHGNLNIAQPSSSQLFLQAKASDSTPPGIDELRVSDIADVDLGRGKLAFLSACSTAQNKVERLWDEELHLVSGFQASGAAGEFGNGEHVARTLNEAMLGMAKKYPEDSLSWAQFVHFGG